MIPPIGGHDTSNRWSGYLKYFLFVQNSSDTFALCGVCASQMCVGRVHLTCRSPPPPQHRLVWKVTSVAAVACAYAAGGPPQPARPPRTSASVKVMCSMSTSTWLLLSAGVPLQLLSACFPPSPASVCTAKKPFVMASYIPVASAVSREAVSIVVVGSV